MQHYPQKLKVSEYFIGVMTGTSLDGLDAVVADFSHPQPRVLASVALGYPKPLKTEMLTLQTGSNGQGVNELHRSHVAGIALADLHNTAILQLLMQAKLTAADIAAVGVHGQTVRHAPNGAQGHPAPYTVQLLDPSRIAEATSCTVVSDFRARDIAAGGTRCTASARLSRRTVRRTAQTCRLGEHWRLCQCDAVTRQWRGAGF